MTLYTLDYTMIVENTRRLRIGNAGNYDGVIEVIGEEI